MTTIAGFAEFADTLRQRRAAAARTSVELLRRLRERLPGDATEVLAEVAVHLDGLLEELDGAEVELRSQNDALFETRLGLDAAEHAFRDCFELAPAACVVTNADSRIERVNDPACELLRRPRNGLLGKPLAAYVALGDREAFRQAMRRTAEWERVESWPVRLTPRRAAPLECLARVRPVRGEGSITLYWHLTEETSAEDCF